MWMTKGKENRISNLWKLGQTLGACVDIYHQKWDIYRLQIDDILHQIEKRTEPNTLEIAMHTKWVTHLFDPRIKL